MSARQYLTLFRTFLVFNVRAAVSFRADFLIGLASTIVMQTAQIGALFLVMAQVPELAGWNVDQILLTYGLLAIARSINHMFGDQLWRLGWMFVKTGDFDKFLLRPVNPLFHFVASRFCQDGLGYMLVGIVLVLKAGLGFGLFISPKAFLCCLVATLGGAGIFFGINLLTASTSFWVIDSLGLMTSVFVTNELAQYPLPIYGKWIQGLLTLILPYGLISFYPMDAVSRGDFYLLAWASPAAALILLVVGVLIWNAGVRHYSSTGS